MCTAPPALTVLAAVQWHNRFGAPAAGLLRPLKQPNSLWWMFPRRIGNKTKFFSPPPFFSKWAFPWAIFPGRPHYYSTETSAPSEPYGWSFWRQNQGEKKRKRWGGDGAGHGGRKGVMDQWKLDDNKCKTKKYGTRSQPALWCHLFAAELKQNWWNCCETNSSKIKARC